MRELHVEELKLEAYDAFHRQWALATAGDINDYNTLTLSWGSYGSLWGRPVVTVYVSPARYSYEYMEKKDWFTVNFFPEECREDLAYLGSHSGRDGDKVAQTKLKPLSVDGCVSFEQAKLMLVCKKLYSDAFDGDRAPEDVRDRLYTKIPAHHFYIGEIVKAYTSDED